MSAGPEEWILCVSTSQIRGEGCRFHLCHPMHLTPQLLRLRSLGMVRACTSLSFLKLMKPLQSVVLLSLTINAKEQVREWKKQIVFIRWTLLHF